MVPQLGGRPVRPPHVQLQPADVGTEHVESEGEPALGPARRIPRTEEPRGRLIAVKTVEEQQVAAYRQREVT